MVDLGEDEDKFHTFMVPLTCKELINGLYYIVAYAISFLW